MIPALLLVSAFAISPPRASRITLPQGVSLEHPTDLALSPDGTRVAFVVRRDDSWIAIASTQNLRRVRILGKTKGAENPFWAPDGRNLAFFHQDELWRINVRSRSIRVICECAGRQGSWGRRGTILFSMKKRGPIQVVPADGRGAARSVTTIDEGALEYAHDYPAFLPDGRRFIFVAATFGQGGAHPVNPGSRAFVASVDGNDRRLLVDDAETAGVLDRKTVIFQRRGALFRLPIAGGATEMLTLQGGPFGANGAGLFVWIDPWLTELAWLDRTGKTVGLLAPPGRYNRQRISPDGRFVAYDEGLLNDPSVVVIREVASGKVVRSLPVGYLGLAWSPDSGSIAVPLRAGGKCTVAIVEVATGTSRSLSPDCEAVYDWSPDGRTIVIRHHFKNHEGFRFLPASGSGTPSDRELVAGWDQGWLRFSPDGTTVTFDGRPVFDGRNVNRFTTPWMGYDAFISAISTEAQPRALSLNGGYRPAWRADGKELFYIDGDRRLLSVSTPPDGQERRTLFVLPHTGIVLAEYDVSPDGSQFLVNREVDILRYVSTKRKR